MRQAVRESWRDLTCAALVDIRQGQRLRHSAILFIIQALAFAVLEIIINDGPDTEIAVEAALGAVEAEVGNVNVARDEEGVRASDESSGGGEYWEEMHLDGVW
jgi:hypothetical protein